MFAALNGVFAALFQRITGVFATLNRHVCRHLCGQIAGAKHRQKAGELRAESGQNAAENG